MSEHTPEPWKTVRDNEALLAMPGDHAFPYRVVWAEPFGDIAYVIADGDDDHGNANARLIVAAPVLLGAAYNLLEVLDGLGADLGHVQEDLTEAMKAAATQEWWDSRAGYRHVTIKGAS